MRFLDATMLVAAATMMTPPAFATELTGVWSGPGAMLAVSPTGGLLQQDCSAGRFGPVKLSRSGTFKVRGTWEDYAPGPQSADAAPVAAKADFEGRITGDTLALTIKRPGRPHQTISLLKGKRAKLIRCL
ncbi:MAG: hypothetical protein JSS55_03390 [Proteobacteria bacterium]|nr:hypothetical protein [Pseudomonadota bacterium]